MTKSSKGIKFQIVKQIKKQHPYFSKLTKKQKKLIIEDVWNKIQNSPAVESPNEAKPHELLGIPETPCNILNINKMRELIQHSRYKTIPLFSRKKDITNPELKFIHKLVDWNLVNHLLAHRSYTPGKCHILPAQYFKAELLKHLRYAELSYRKFCKQEINNAERKENRAFLGIGKGQNIDHSQLSQFRSAMTFEQSLNLMIYFICLFFEHKELDENLFYVVDSTELAAKINSCPLFKIKVGQETIRFYQDIEADCGARRSKRDKSKYVVGYRLHSLTVVDVKSGQAFPLLSILAAANHHDSNFLKLLIELGKAIGLELNLVAGDQAYGDPEQIKEINAKHNVVVLNSPKETVKLPAFVNEQTGTVRKNALCCLDMEYCGKDEEHGHEFHCIADYGQCPFEERCDKVRFIKVDCGRYGQIPYHLKDARKLLSMRKVAERPNNLIKHRDGLEPLRPKGQHNSTVAATIANITTLLIEIAGFRKKKKPEKAKAEQLQIFRQSA
jgi:hypothetical protein